MTTPARIENGMSKAEVALLLATIAAYDQRTIGDADVLAWHAAAQYAKWDTDGARQAVVAYYAESRTRIMPADVTAGIRAGRVTNPWVGIRWV
jgi:hypothetical protein